MQIHHSFSSSKQAGFPPVQSGFTLAELILVMLIFTTLVGIATINLAHIQRRSSMTSSINMLATDMKEQQVKAMVGDTESRASPDNYGIYFGTSSYTLFHGTYSATDSANTVIPIDATLHFATPGASIIFTRESGDVLNYSINANLIIIQDITNGEVTKLKFNKFGAIIGTY